MESPHTGSMSDTSHVHLHMRLPAGLIAAVDVLAKKDLLTRTSWVTRALLSACEVAQEPQESLSDRLAALDAQVAEKLEQAQRLNGGAHR